MWKWFPPSVLPVPLLMGRTLILNVPGVGALGCLAPKSGFAANLGAFENSCLLKRSPRDYLELFLSVNIIFGEEGSVIATSPTGVGLASLPRGNLEIQRLTLNLHLLFEQLLCSLQLSLYIV